MKSEALIAEIRRLVLGEKWSIGTVARRLGVHHSVVRRAAYNDAVASRPRTAKSVLDPFKPYLVERLEKYPELTASRLLLEIRDRGYSHGIAIVRRFVAQLRAPRSKKVYLRIEVEPADQAQVDWGSFGKLRVGGTQRPMSTFVMVLSWSRAVYLDFSLDQKMETFLAMHRRAFEFFGGVPRKILYDNLKSVVLHHVGQTVQFNPTFLGFAGHYLFEPTAAPVRYPEAKGRAEAIIKYIRHAFFYGRCFGSLDELRAQAAHWGDEGHNPRLHATTRQRPCDRLLIERGRLRKLPERPADTDLLVAAIVSKEARVRLDANSYSVPPGLVGKNVFIRADDKTVRIDVDGAVVAEHNRCWDRHRAIEDPAHIASLLERRRAARLPKRRVRIAELSDACRVYLQEVARRRIHLNNEVRRLDRLVAHYGETDIAQAIADALAARTFGANYVRALADQRRLAGGLGEPPEPIITGNPTADALVVKPHNLETYDALFKDQNPKDQNPKAQSKTRPGADDPSRDD